MENHDEITWELKDIAPRLSGMKRSEPFQAPADYFEGLPSRVQDRISKARPADAVPVLDWLSRYRWAPVLTSVLVALIFSVVLYLNRGTGSGDITAQVQKPVENAVLQGTAEVSTEELADVLSDTDVEELIADAEIPVSKIAPVEGKSIVRKPAKAAESAALKEYILDNFDEYTITETL